MNKPKFTFEKKQYNAENANTFDHNPSMGNMTTVLENFKCGCQPYEDVFTFKRWLAMGYCVKKGEHGVKIPIILKGKAEFDNGEQKDISTCRHTTVFCRHQVELLKK